MSDPILVHCPPRESQDVVSWLNENIAVLHRQAAEYSERFVMDGISNRLRLEALLCLQAKKTLRDVRDYLEAQQ